MIQVAVPSTAVEFVMVAEAGILEAQALLLVESIRRFTGVHSRSRITVVSPRRDRRPSRSTLRALERLEAEYRPIHVDSCCAEYGTSYRVHSLARIEPGSGPDIIVQLDSDTVFLGEPDLTLGDHEAAARPVDMKGMCTAGPGDSFNAYWRAICQLADVDYDQFPTVTSTVDREHVKASHNGGLIIARRSHGLFTRTEELLRSMVVSGHKPWGDQSPILDTGTGLLSGAATAHWGTSQAAFSLACAAARVSVRALPASHNFPLHLVELMARPLPLPLVHVHYHRMFTAGAGVSNPLIDGSIAIAADAAEWLRARLPLHPTTS